MGRNDIDIFLNRVFENSINVKMFDLGYTFEKEKVDAYIQNLLAMPFGDYIDFILEFELKNELLPSEIVQFSSFNDCTYNVCKALELNGDMGSVFDEVGSLLLNDGKQRKDCAKKKYGENHLKAACDLGLIQCKDKFYFLSCLGHEYCDLSILETRELVARMCLRTKLIRIILSNAKNDVVELNTLLGFLSPSTFIRRKPNILLELRKVYESASPSYFKLFSNIQVFGSSVFK